MYGWDGAFWEPCRQHHDVCGLKFEKEQVAKTTRQKSRRVTCKSSWKASDCHNPPAFAPKSKICSSSAGNGALKTLLAQLCPVPSLG